MAAKLKRAGAGVFLSLLVASGLSAAQPSPLHPLPETAFHRFVVATPVVTAEPIIPTRTLRTPAPVPTATTRPTSRPKATVQARSTKPSSGRPYGETIQASATWCAPKGKYCHGWDRAFVGAVAGFTWGDTRYKVEVCEIDARIPGRHCTTVTVVSFCACRDKKGIDLSVPAMRELRGMSLGRIRVEITRTS